MIEVIIIVIIIVAILKRTKRVQGARPSRPVQPSQPYNPVQPQQPVQPVQQDIVSRAKTNTNKLKEDTTLKELEKQHNHKEKQQPKPVEHSEVCQTHDKGLADVITPQESLLGSVEDLMVKGYSGSMHFERDFVGEAMDMISNFTIADFKPADEEVKKGA